MSSRCKSVFDIPAVAAELADRHDGYVVVRADKASNNIVFVCKTHCINFLREELGLNASVENPTHTRTSLSQEEILKNHKTVLLSFRISAAEEDLGLPKINWIPKFHKDPYKHRYIAAKCSTKYLSQILTKSLQ